jgi:hypothetical protein
MYFYGTLVSIGRDLRGADAREKIWGGVRDVLYQRAAVDPAVEPVAGRMKIDTLKCRRAPETPIHRRSIDRRQGHGGTARATTTWWRT